VFNTITKNRQMRIGSLADCSKSNFRRKIAIKAALYSVTGIYKAY